MICLNTIKEKREMHQRKIERLEEYAEFLSECENFYCTDYQVETLFTLINKTEQEKLCFYKGIIISSDYIPFLQTLENLESYGKVQELINLGNWSKIKRLLIQETELTGFIWFHEEIITAEFVGKEDSWISTYDYCTLYFPELVPFLDMLIDWRIENQTLDIPDEVFERINENFTKKLCRK